MVLKSIAKRLLSTSTIPKLFNSKRFVFVYHDIAEKTDGRYSPHYSVTTAHFESHLQLLQARFQLVPLEELVGDKLGTENYASIVFDDGFQSVKDVALSILESQGISFALFINKSAVERNQLWVNNLIMHQHNEYYLKQVWKSGPLANQVSFDEFRQNPVGVSIAKMYFAQGIDELYLPKTETKKIYLDGHGVRFLAEKGVLIGSHTLDHVVMSNTEKKELINQVVENKIFVESLTGKSNDHFAIPFGKKDQYNGKVIELLKQEGYRYIYTTNPNCFTHDDLQNSSMLIPRIWVPDTPASTLSFYINRALLKKSNI